MEQGEETLLKCAEALEMMLSRACCCNKKPIALGSGLREEEMLELEYALENKVFATPVPDFMTLVLEGNSSHGEHSSCLSVKENKTDATSSVLLVW